MLISAPEDLAGELAGMLRRGVSSEGLLASQALLGLALVRAKSPTAEPGDLAAAATGLLTEIAALVDGQRYGASAVLLAVCPGWRGTLLKSRRAEAAQLLGIDVDYFRKEREDGLR